MVKISPRSDRTEEDLRSRGDEGISASTAGGVCAEPSERSRLLLYALSGCGEEDALAFEAHVLACETCFQDLKCLDRARALFEEFTAPSAPHRERIQRVLRGVVEARATGSGIAPQTGEDARRL